MEKTLKDKTVWKIPSAKKGFPLLCLLFFIFFLKKLFSADFFQNNVFKKYFQEYHQSVKQFGTRSVPTNCQPYLFPKCLQRFSADDTCRYM